MSEGGDDCDDNEPVSFQMALESAMVFAILSQMVDVVPSFKYDNDGDGFIECEPVAEWQGSQVILAEGL